MHFILLAWINHLFGLSDSTEDINYSSQSCYIYNSFKEHFILSRNLIKTLTAQEIKYEQFKTYLNIKIFKLKYKIQSYLERNSEESSSSSSSENNEILSIFDKITISLSKIGKAYLNSIEKLFYESMENNSGINWIENKLNEKNEEVKILIAEKLESFNEELEFFVENSFMHKNLADKIKNKLEKIIEKFPLIEKIEFDRSFE